MSPWVYQANILRWVDGDTAYVTISLGFYVTTVQRLRLLGSNGGVNCYEKHDLDPSKRALAMQGWQEAERLLPAGTACIVKTTKAVKGDPQDGFGRFLAQIITLDGVNIGDQLMADGLAVPYVRGG